MRLGIFAKTFVRSSLPATLDAVIAHGLDCVQFNMACCGMTSMPDRITLDLCEEIRGRMASRSIEMAAVSGTFNMIHPDRRCRRDGLERLQTLAGAARHMGTSIVTLCTGSRDAENMWRRHPDNDTPAAWTDLIECMREAVRIAADTGVTLAIEPEISNVIDTATKARRLLDEIGSPQLKIVIDGANLFHKGQLPRMREILDEAVGLLGADIVLAHAKDLSEDGQAGHEAAGQGLLDFDFYLRRLEQAGYNGPLILHGLDEAQVDGSVGFLRGILDGMTREAGQSAKGSP